MVDRVKRARRDRVNGQDRCLVMIVVWCMGVGGCSRAGDARMWRGYTIGVRLSLDSSTGRGAHSLFGVLFTISGGMMAHSKVGFGAPAHRRCGICFLRDLFWVKLFARL